MMDQDLINRMESDIVDFERPKASDTKELLRNHKLLIEGNADLHREKMMLQNALEQIAKSDPGASGNIARKIMGSYGFDYSQD